VYVQAFPQLGERWQISKDGGLDPRWSRDGNELFYFNGSKFMSVDVRTQLKFDPRPPRLLFDYGFEEGDAGEYDVSPDGKRFLMLQRTDAERPATRINVVINWMEELKQRVPSGQ
jgi:Tol biopolymer transport system component